MTLAAETREAARAHPFLHDALQAGVVNYTAAARFLDLGGDVEAAATALRRYAESFDGPAGDGRDPDAGSAGADRTTATNVTMQRGTGVVEAADDAILTVGDAGLAPGRGSLTVILATGAVDAPMLERVLGRLRVDGVPVQAAGLTDASLSVAVPDREAATALRIVEECV